MDGQPRSPSVLVSAASMHGATAEIAQAIGDQLTKRGVAASVIPPGDVWSIEGYDAVIIGSAVYTGHWLDPAKGLVNKFHDTLPDRPVWLFSSGPVGKPSGRLAQAMNADPVELDEIRSATNAREHRIFAGKLDPKALSRLQRASLLVFRGLEGDFRDWAEIRNWADSIARELALVPQ